MLNRRLFFRALAGSPALAVAAPKEKPVRVTLAGNICECGLAMLCHGSLTYREDGEFFTCSNPACPHYDKPVLMPSVALQPADREKVARIRARERQWWEQTARSRFHRDAFAFVVGDAAHTSRG